MQCRVGCPSVRLSVCPVDRHLPLAAAWARATYRSIAAGARAAAAGSVMLRAEVRGSAKTCCSCNCRLVDGKPSTINWRSEVLKCSTAVVLTTPWRAAATWPAPAEAVAGSGPSGYLILSLCFILLPQTDRATLYIRQNLVKCRNNLYSKSTTSRSNGVRGLQLTNL